MDNLEQKAANVDDTTVVDEVIPTEVVEQPTSPVDNGAKAYAERLNKDRDRIRTEERENIAKNFGYETWDEYIKVQTDSKLLDNGLDPEMVRPVIKDLIKNDPEYVEAMIYKKQQEELQAKLWGEQELKKLNDKFGTSFNSIDQLDGETIKLFNEGVSLDKAYASQHYEEIQESAVKKAKLVNGKEHLTKIDGSEGTQTNKITMTQDELRAFRELNPFATEEQIQAYITRLK